MATGWQSAASSSTGWQSGASSTWQRNWEQTRKDNRREELDRRRAGNDGARWQPTGNDGHSQDSADKSPEECREDSDSEEPLPTQPPLNSGVPAAPAPGDPPRVRARPSADRAGPPQKVSRWTESPPTIPPTIQVCLKCRVIVQAWRTCCDVCSDDLFVYTSQPKSFEIRIKCEVHPEAAVVSLV